LEENQTKAEKQMKRIDLLAGEVIECTFVGEIKN
jgi:hypothetical protein